MLISNSQNGYKCKQDSAALYRSKSELAALYSDWYVKTHDKCKWDEAESILKECIEYNEENQRLDSLFYSKILLADLYSIYCDDNGRYSLKYLRKSYQLYKDVLEYYSIKTVSRNYWYVKYKTVVMPVQIAIEEENWDDYYQSQKELNAFYQGNKEHLPAEISQQCLNTLNSLKEFESQKFIPEKRPKRNMVAAILDKLFH